MLVNYSSNNSGGDWWLKDEDWHNLEKAGWNVHWKKDETDKLLAADEDGRWLGALATSASKKFDTMRKALQEFEKVTRQAVSDEGCNCCGPPHNFSAQNGEDWIYCSGEDCLEYLFDNVPNNLRDACF